MLYAFLGMLCKVSWNETAISAFSNDSFFQVLLLFKEIISDFGLNQAARYGMIFDYAMRAEWSSLYSSIYALLMSLLDQLQIFLYEVYF